MRISIGKNDPGYKNWIENKDRVPYLNGKKVEDAVMADEEEGCVTVLQRDENGSIVLLDSNNKKVKPYRYRIHEAIKLLEELFEECGQYSRIAETTLYGKVKIKEKEE